MICCRKFWDVYDVRNPNVSLKIIFPNSNYHSNSKVKNIAYPDFPLWLTSLFFIPWSYPSPLPFFYSPIPFHTFPSPLDHAYFDLGLKSKHTFNAAHLFYHLVLLYSILTFTPALTSGKWRKISLAGCRNQPTMLMWALDSPKWRRSCH